MAAFSNYIEDALINWMRGTAFPSPPANWYVALYTSATDDASGGTEVSGGSYVRSVVPAATGSFSAPAGGTGATSNTVTIPFVPATADWGLVTHAAIYDAASNGNRILHGAFTVPRLIPSGATFTIGIGDLDLTLA